MLGPLLGPLPTLPGPGAGALEKSLILPSGVRAGGNEIESLPVGKALLWAKLCRVPVTPGARWGAGVSPGTAAGPPAPGTAQPPALWQTERPHPSAAGARAAWQAGAPRPD